MALHVLEHASSSEAALRWIQGIASKVKLGGRILIVCPNYLDLGGFFMMPIGPMDGFQQLRGL